MIWRSASTVPPPNRSREIPFRSGSAGGVRLFFKRSELDQWRWAEVSTKFPRHRKPQ